MIVGAKFAASWLSDEFVQRDAWICASLSWEECPTKLVSDEANNVHGTMTKNMLHRRSPALRGPIGWIMSDLVLLVESAAGGVLQF